MKNECIIEWCEKGVMARGYCSMHYSRWRKGADMDAPPIIVGDDESRFLSYIDKSDSCWIWQGKVSTNGYALFSLRGKWVSAHRHAWARRNGGIPKGLDVDHMCHNRLCVNVSHLRLATRSQNLQNQSGPYSSSSSGVRGVYWHEPTQKWMARAQLNGKDAYLGLHLTREEAEGIVTAWRRENMPYSLMDQGTEEGIVI